jgi:integrase
MASLTKDPRGWSKYWVCCYTAADGRQLKRSTRETDKRLARTICEAWEQAEGMGQAGFLTSETQFRRVFNEAVDRIFGKKLDDPTVREWLTRWLKTEQGAVAEATLRKYRQIVGAFLEFLGTRADVRLEALSTDDFLRYRDALLSEGRSEQTVNITVRKILKRPFNLAADQGLITRNPVAAVRLMRGTRAEKGVFRPEQITRLLAVADSDWQGLILAGYYTGARLGDLARLKWESIDLAERSITFTQKKTGAKIKVPIHSELLDYLLNRSVPDDGRRPLFPSLYHLRGPGKTGLSSSFRRLMDRAGIDGGLARQKAGQAGRNVSRLSFHSLRHSFTSALANAGVPPEIRQKLTGHADLKSHALYSHHDFELVRQSVQTIASLPKAAEADK